MAKVPPRQRSPRPARHSSRIKQSGTAFFPPSIVAAQAYREQQYLKSLAEAKQRIELSERVKELRYYLHGFESNKYNLNRIGTWTARKRAHVTEVSKNLRQLISPPHIVHPVPRGDSVSARAKRRALEAFTRSSSRLWKRFVIFTEDPDSAFITFDDQYRITLHLPHRGGSFDRKFFLWKEFTRREPVTFRQQQKVLKKMLPHMPDGKYGLWSTTSGVLDMPQDKRFLHQMLDRYHLAYEPPSLNAMEHKGFARVVAGFVYMGTQEQVNKYRRRIAKERTARSNRNRLHRRSVVSAARRKVTRKSLVRCTHKGIGRAQCVLTLGHKGKHRYTKRK